MPKIRNRKRCASREARPRWQGEEAAPAPATPTPAPAWRPAHVFRGGDKEELRRVLHKEPEEVPPTVMAVVLGRFDVLKMLLKKGCFIDSVDDEGNTACNWAARLGNRQMAELLLSRGADPRARNLQGDSVLLAAAQHPAWSEAAFLDLLALAGDRIDTSCRNADGWTLLHYAVKNQWAVVAGRLLDAGADVDAATRRGASALMLAASTGHHAILQALVAARANIFQEDERGCTAFCYSIAFMMRKRLKEPSVSVLVISSAIRTDDQSVGMDAYLERRMKLLWKPPEGVPDYVSIVSGIISLVLLFFARFVRGGYELLLDTGLFRCVAQALLQHVAHEAYARALLSLLLQLLLPAAARSTRPDAAGQFAREGAADACLGVLKWYKNTTSSEEVKRAAMMPLIVACSSKGSARVWLQENYKSVRLFFKYEDWCPPSFKCGMDNERLVLFARKCQSFNTLMTNLKNGLDITHSARHKKSKAESAQPQAYQDCHDRANMQESKYFQLELLNENGCVLNPHASANRVSLVPRESSEFVAKLPNVIFDPENDENHNFSTLEESTQNCIEFSVRKNNPSGKDNKIGILPLNESQVNNDNLENSNDENNNSDINVDVYNNNNYLGVIGHPKRNTESNGSKSKWSHNTDIFPHQFIMHKTGSGDEQPLDKSQRMKTILDSTYHMGKKILAACNKTKPIVQTQDETFKMETIPVPPSNIIISYQKHMEESETDSSFYDNLMTCLDHSKNAFSDHSLSPDLRALHFLFNNLASKYVHYWKLDYLNNYPLSTISNMNNLVQMRKIIPVLEHQNLCYLTKVWNRTSTYLQTIDDGELFNKKTLGIRYMILKLDKALDKKIETIKRIGATPIKPDVTNESKPTEVKEKAPISLNRADTNQPKTEEDLLQDCNQVVNSVIGYLNLEDEVDLTEENNDEYDFLFNDSTSEHCGNDNAQHDKPQRNGVLQSQNVAHQDPFLEVCIDNYLAPDSNSKCQEKALDGKFKVNRECEISKTDENIFKKENEGHGKLFEKEESTKLSTNRLQDGCLLPNASKNTKYSSQDIPVSKYIYNLSKTANATTCDKPIHKICTKVPPPLLNSVNDGVLRKSSSIQFLNGSITENFESTKSPKNFPKLINVMNHDHSSRKSPHLDTEPAKVQIAKLYSDSIKSESSSVFTDCTSPKKNDANNTLADIQTVYEIASVNCEAGKELPRRKCSVTIADKLFHLALRPQPSKNDEEAPSQKNAQINSEQSNTRSSGVFLTTHTHPNRVSPLKLGSKWDRLAGAFLAMSPALRQTAEGGKLAVSRREVRASFKVAPSLELGAGVDGSPLAVRRLRSPGEALLAAVGPLLGLSHPNMLPYLLADRLDGDLLVAMPLCERNLEQHLAELRVASALRAKAKDITWQIMRGLQFLHSLYPPVVHGNLKPSNILVDAAGVIRLADFGLGQVLWQPGCKAHQSVVWGPPEYLEPCGHRRAPVVTAKGDVFSAGLVMHYVVTGGLHPFGDTRHQIFCNMARGAPCLRSSEADLAHLLSAMLAPRPADRPFIRDILRHVFFWDKSKKWDFLLACAGFEQQGASSASSHWVAKLYHFIDSTAAALNIFENWVGIVKATFPEAAREPPTLSALLRFVRRCAEAECGAGGGSPGAAAEGRQQLARYFLAAFPNLPLKLFRLLDGSGHAAKPQLAHFFFEPELVRR